jgi:ABC-2 type transport system ATP-binding protein
MGDAVRLPVVRVAGLRKRYSNGVEAVRGLSFDVARGEIVGILGPNGAGKTTTIEILMGFRDRDAGDVSILGFDPARKSDLRAIRKHVGVVLQFTGHLRYQTVRETIAMHAAYHAGARDVDEVLAMVELTDAADQLVRAISGGQQRRLDVAVALVGRPDVLFLDEPTTGFDPGARRRMWELVRQLADGGTAVVLTTHYMEEASALADRVLVVRSGEIVGEGTPAQLSQALRMGSTISASLPLELTADDLPAAIRDGLTHAGAFRLEKRDDVTDVVAVLTTWAVERGIVLADLDVRAPSLEDSYLALTADGDA